MTSNDGDGDDMNDHDDEMVPSIICDDSNDDDNHNGGYKVDGGDRYDDGDEEILMYWLMVR